MSAHSIFITVAAAAYVALGLLTARLRGAPPTRLDIAIQGRVLASTWTHRRRAGVVGSAPGYPGIYFALTAVLIWVLRSRDKRGITSLIVASVGGWAIHRLIKLFVVRRRPASRAGHSHELEAFPSGHTTATTAIALTVGYVFSAQAVLSPAFALTIAIGVPVLVGCSRVLADEHWTTDVVGGWLGGIGTAAIAILLFLHDAR